MKGDPQMEYVQPDANWYHQGDLLLPTGLCLIIQKGHYMVVKGDLLISFGSKMIIKGKLLTTGNVFNEGCIDIYGSMSVGLSDDELYNIITKSGHSHVFPFAKKQA